MKQNCMKTKQQQQVVCTDGFNIWCQSTVHCSTERTHITSLTVCKGKLGSGRGRECGSGLLWGRTLYRKEDLKKLGQEVLNDAFEVKITKPLINSAVKLW